MKALHAISLAGLLGGCALATACGGDDSGATPGAGGSSSASSSGGDASTSTGFPASFVNVTSTEFGAYAVSPIQGTDAGGAGDLVAINGAGDKIANCAAVYGLVRDFKMGNTPDGHPDFEKQAASDTEIVEELLGDDRKPVYKGPSSSTTGKENFDQWYRDVPNVNRAFVLGLGLERHGTVYSFRSESFFPLDGQGFGDQGQAHNFSFTTEIHASFKYQGGEQFAFLGDDDVFVFINNHIIINLGGIHGSQTTLVKLDDVAASIGIAVGEVYPVDIFHAERHTTESHYRFDTTLGLTNCGELPSDVGIDWQSAP